MFTNVWSYNLSPSSIFEAKTLKKNWFSSYSFFKKLDFHCTIKNENGYWSNYGHVNVTQKNWRCRSVLHSPSQHTITCESFTNWSGILLCELFLNSLCSNSMLKTIFLTPHLLLTKFSLSMHFLYNRRTFFWWGQILLLSYFAKSEIQ